MLLAFNWLSLVSLLILCLSFLCCNITKSAHVFLFVAVQSLSCIQLFATPWTAACQASLSFIISWSLLKFMSIESVMVSNHLILCCPLLLPSIFPSIRVLSNELALRIRWPKYLSYAKLKKYQMDKRLNKKS